MGKRPRVSATTAEILRSPSSRSTASCLILALAWRRYFRMDLGKRPLAMNSSFVAIRREASRRFRRLAFPAQPAAELTKSDAAARTQTRMGGSEFSETVEAFWRGTLLRAGARHRVPRRMLRAAQQPAAFMRHVVPLPEAASGGPAHGLRTSRTARLGTTCAAAQSRGSTRSGLGPRTPGREPSAQPAPARACGRSTEEDC